VSSRRRKIDDADADLQDRIDKRSAKIILRAAKRLRGVHSRFLRFTHLQIRKENLRWTIESGRLTCIHLDTVKQT